MILKNQIKFLQRSYENVEKFNFYLSISNPKESCEVALVLKRHYQWVLKNSFCKEVEDNQLIKFFNDLVKDLSYIPAAKLEYDDLKKLVTCHFSLGELYIQKNNRSFAQEHFEKVIEVLSVITKEQSRLFNMVQDNSDITIFELSMWARKNLGDICSDVEKSLDLYEQIVSDREFLFLEKNKCIYYAAKTISDVDKAYEAAINVLKVIPYYENVDKDVVVFLKDKESYIKSLEICYNQYLKTKDKYFIDIASQCCKETKNFTMEYLQKVIEILNETLYSLDFKQWKLLSKTLYDGIKNDDILFEGFVKYLNNMLIKISYKNGDYKYFDVCIDILREVYDDIDSKKYNNKLVRDLEENIIFYFMVAAFNNGFYDESIECSTKLLSINEIHKIDFDVNIINEVLRISVNKLTGTKNTLESYPWSDLVGKLKDISKKCNRETDIEYNEQCRIMGRGIKVLEILPKYINEESILDKLIEENGEFKEKVDKEEYVILESSQRNLDLADISVVMLKTSSGDLKQDILNSVEIYKKKNLNKVLFVIKGVEHFTKKDIEEFNSWLEKTGFNINISIYNGKNYNDVLEKIQVLHPNNITMYRYNEFYNNLSKELNYINQECEDEFLKKGLEVQLMEEASFKYKEFDDEVKSNIENFKDRVTQDTNLLQEYINTKINTIVPAVIEENVKVVDELKESKNIREEARNKVSEEILIWYKENMNKLMKSQFDIFLSKYEKIYFNELEVIRNINNNTNKVIPISEEFAKEFKEIKFIENHKLKEKISMCYEDYINSLDDEISLFPKKNVLKNLTSGLSTIFSKQNEKDGGKYETIKREIIEDSIIVCDNLYSAIFSSVEELTLKLHLEIENVYKELLEALAQYKLLSNKILEIKKIERTELKNRNNEISKNIEFVNVQLEKYKKQILQGLVYNKGFVYKA
ncbi:hypothetical protein KQI36_04015 [Clostridium senegalense]|uniref:hypothetical protein n=1 Tax=Clostridium senegalense TaxID=1465809 RepID=UPI001C127F61|nr:hypothetical protein [Clostridium senegalense]MBU5225834.1 hypothetical protein [Clostridium senegalense]